MITSIEASLGVTNEIVFEYNKPIRLPTGFTAHCPKTVQGTTLLKIQCHSTTAACTYFIDPASPPHVPVSGTIKSNDPAPRLYSYDWNGASLKIANVSQEYVIMEVTLIAQGLR
jgi:hypothetical protein